MKKQGFLTLLFIHIFFLELPAASLICIPHFLRVMQFLLLPALIIQYLLLSLAYTENPLYLIPWAEDKEFVHVLATVPGRFEFVFTPKHGSWLNMVEGFFSKMTKQMFRGIRVKSKAELVDRIYLYFDEVNAETVVFHWKYNLDDIDVSEEVIVDTLL